jgi:hypothetical protein
MGICVLYRRDPLARTVDIWVSPALLVGGAFGYERSVLSTIGISGNGDIDTYVVDLYASYEHAQWHADATLGYAYSHGALERSVVFPGVSRTARGSPDANEFLSTVETGYRLSVGEHIAVTPLPRFRASSSARMPSVKAAPVPSICMSVARSRSRQAAFLVWSSRIDWTSDQSGRF